MSGERGPGTTHDAVIVGGGLAGLTAAALLARAGLDVALFERSGSLGGRARTTVEDGFHLNLGPHALYSTGPGADVLRRLDAFPEGGRPPGSGVALVGDRVERLPGGPWSLLRTGLLGAGGKLRLMRAMIRLQRTDPASLAGLDVGSWVEGLTEDDDVRALIRALIRLTSYVDAPDQAADAAVAQLQRGVTDGVVYPDGGWQRIVDTLGARAADAGARITAGAPVTAVHHAGGRVRGVTVGGARIDADAVLLAVAPEAAARLAQPELATLREAARAAEPVHMATLDLGLRSLPASTHMALGIDRPVYFSVHSRWAELAPRGGAMVHVAWYLSADAPDPATIEAELERVLDRLQPGWRDEVVVRRFLPRMTVLNARVRAPGGLGARPDPAVPDVDGLFIAGDWVGGTGMLSDASRVSAEAAAERIIRRHAQRERHDSERRRAG